MKLRKFAFSLAMLAAIASPALAADLKIGIGEDPDALDPDQSRTFVGEVVFANMCDKLVNIQPDLTIIPQLATDWTCAPRSSQVARRLVIVATTSIARASVLPAGSNKVMSPVPAGMPSCGQDERVM